MSLYSIEQLDIIDEEVIDVYKMDIGAYQESIIETRRALHQIPESGFEEYKTQAYLKAFLSKLENVQVFETAKTGLLAWVDAGFSESVALRTDIDALSMTEMTTHTFKSIHEGHMHACGHDGHMTVMLHMTKWLSEHRQLLKKNVLVIFQPAEEGPGGAKLIIDEGTFDKYKVKEVYGYHLHPEVEQGYFATRKGPLMAMTGEFDITIQGISGHGAMPHKGMDTAVIAAELILKLQNIVSRRLNPIEPAVVTIGKVSIGERRNIIAQTAVLEGTCRAFSETVFDKIEACMRDYVNGLAISYGIQIDLDFRVTYPPVINDSALVDSFIQANGAKMVREIELQMIAEDFSLYQKIVPGIFVFIGIRNEAKGFTYPLHSSKFDFDEDALTQGIEGLINMFDIRGVI
jgi:amidohydrolase